MTQPPLPELSAAAPPPAPQLSIPPDAAYNLAYQEGMFLTAGEMTLAQNYFVTWLQLQNQLLYTPGVLSGLLVTNPSGNNLSVSSGAGVDGAGHFVLLADGAGNTITVPSGAANPCYVGLSYPATPQPVAGLPYTVNMAGILSVANSVDQLPNDSLLLAQIDMNAQGGIASIKDMRTPVTSRLPANLDAATSGAVVSSLPPQSCSGVALVHGSGLRKQGDSVSQVVYFLPQQTPVFGRTPQVVVTVRGSLPFATSVSEVAADRFTLTLTAVLTPAADSIDDVHVNWLAYV